MDTANERDLEIERRQAVIAILESTASKKLIVAGPGTGKTYTFKQALEKAGGGVALTFIRALVRDLRADLDDAADIVNTFHGFAKHLLHRRPYGVRPDFSYCPPLPIILARDLTLLGLGRLAAADIDSAFQQLDDSRGLIKESVQLGDYYNAVGHNDVVYRVLRCFEEFPNEIPQYPLVVVDEYQDFNPLETGLIETLARRSPVLIAGDDDQALYFRKNASPKYIRELAMDSTFAKFPLPFCSRCTQVIVDAVNNVIERALANGNLAGRLDKPFACYLPGKLKVSERHPTIIHAHCSVESSTNPYIARYVSEQIAQIPIEDVAASREGRYPTALVIGTGEFVKPVFEHLRTRFPNVKQAGGRRAELTLLEAYRLLAWDPGSRLGWRIALELDPPPNLDGFLTRVLEGELELTQNLPAGFSDRHLPLAESVQQLIAEEEISVQDQTVLERLLGLSVEQIRRALRPTDDEEAEDKLGDPEEPTIVCSTMVSAKGLSAEHVFIVGFNDGHFPRNPRAITDYEICCLLVALSRTRTQCHVVSCGRWKGQTPNRVSAFRNWLGVPIDETTRNAAHWNANPPR
jgi:superfamily I DNA/RNA helicase